MKVNPKYLNVLLAVLLLSSGTAGQALETEKMSTKQGKAQPVAVGMQAPDFSLTSGEGKTVSLGDFKGKKSVVLYFYPKDETTVCTKEACSFRDNFQAFTDLGAEVIGVSADSVESHANFSKHHKLPFILLSDSENKVRKTYGVPSTFGMIPGRVTYVIDKQGVVRYLFNSQMQGEKHVTEALRILKELK